MATVNLKENCKCKGAGGGRLGRGPGHRSRSPKARYERGAQGIHVAVRVVEAMWHSVAIRARLSKRKGKEQFSSAWEVVCRSFWPSFLKSYTVDGQYKAVNLGLWSRVTPWASVEEDLEFAKPGMQILVSISGRTSKRLRGSRGLNSS